MMREELIGRGSSGHGHEDGDAERLPSSSRSAAFTAEPVAKRSEDRPATAADVSRGNTIRDADARHEREGQPGAGEVGRSGENHSREQEQCRGRGDAAARNQDWTLPDLSREPPERRGEQNDEWPRCHREPGPDRRVTPDLAEKLDIPKKHDREARAVEKLTEVRPAEAALGEEVEREHRVRDGGALSGERAEQHDSAEERSTVRVLDRPPRAGLNDREGEENERDGDDNRPDGVGQPRTIRLARLVQQPPSEDRDGDADRNVDDEHRAPTPRFDEEPTDGRTQRGGRRPCRSQSAMACGTLDFGKARRISASDAGVSAAAPNPCRTLAATSAPTLGATAQSAEATVKNTHSGEKTRRRPRRSSHRPAPIIPARGRSCKPERIHDNAAALTSGKSRRMVPKAT